LWSGSTEPFHGRFHSIDDFAFEPLPVRRDGLPIVIGGRAEPALRRAGTLGDGYHSSAADPATYGQRVPVVLAAAEAAGRPAPWLSARVRVQFEAAGDESYAMRGTPEQIAAEVRAFAGHGATHLGLWFGTTDPG